MSDNDYKYHILERTIDSDPTGSGLLTLLENNGYPINTNQNHTHRWICFDGQKTTDLEAAFLAYEVDNPPSFMTKTKNMDHHEAKVITRTEGETESTGWVVL